MLSLVYPYYEAPTMLATQVASWNALDDRCAVEIVVVDDGSPTAPAAPIVERQIRKSVRCSVYRIEQDIEWNQHGARNLGAVVAAGPWLLLSDIDVVLPTLAVEQLLAMRLDAKRHYTIERESVTRQGYRKPHCNTVLLTRDAFFEIGGYDEDYCGTYGGDGPFLRALRSARPPVHLPEIVALGYGRMGSAPAVDGADSFLDRLAGKQRYRERYRAKLAAGDVTPVCPLRFTWSRVL